MGSCKESNQNIPVLQNDDTTYVAFTDQSSGPGVADTSEQLLVNYFHYIPRRKSGIYWIQVRRAAAAVEISLWTR